MYTKFNTIWTWENQHLLVQPPTTRESCLWFYNPYRVSVYRLQKLTLQNFQKFNNTPFCGELAIVPKPKVALFARTLRVIDRYCQHYVI